MISWDWPRDNCGVQQQYCIAEAWDVKVTFYSLRSWMGFESRLYRRASNRHISGIVATVIVVSVCIVLTKIIVI